MALQGAPQDLAPKNFFIATKELFHLNLKWPPSNSLQSMSLDPALEKRLTKEHHITLSKVLMGLTSPL